MKMPTMTKSVQSKLALIASAGVDIRRESNGAYVLRAKREIANKLVQQLNSSDGVKVNQIGVEGEFVDMTVSQNGRLLGQVVS